MGLKIRAKVFDKYFRAIREGKKAFDLRQFDEIEFVNTETGEVAGYEIVSVERLPVREEEDIRRKMTDVPWHGGPICKIRLGKKRY